MQPPRSRQIPAIIAVLLIGVAAACTPGGAGVKGDGTSTIENHPASSAPPDISIGVLTPDGTDGYVVTRTDGKLKVAAPTTNRSGNLRLALVERSSPVSSDQQACVSWWGPIGSVIQPGLVLRSSFDSGRARAIMVSDNIWYGNRKDLNVHVFDSAAGPARLDLVAQVDMETGLGGLHDPNPPPWRFCARVQGTSLRIKAWSPTAEPKEPSWEDRSRTKTVELPENVPTEGRPGIYVGHLEPGTTTEFSDPATTAIPPG